MSVIAQHTKPLLFPLSLVLLLSCTSRPVPAPVSEVHTGRSIHQVDKNALRGKNRYQVRQGDTLYLIAWQAGVDYEELARLNGISSPYLIRPGQQLLLAKRSKPAKTTPKSNKKSPGKTSVRQTKVQVDPKKQRAYRESQVVVKNQKATSNNPSQGQVVKQWKWPTKGKIIQRFGPGNKGIDIAGKMGSPIVAAAAGKVVYAGNALRGYGNLVIVKHNQHYLSAYAHTEKILVKEQQWIAAGERIATMGKSGTSRTKLHFEVRHKGKSVDPLRFLPR